MLVREGRENEEDRVCMEGRWLDEGIRVDEKVFVEWREVTM